jgi:hypothetical protein
MGFRLATFAILVLLALGAPAWAADVVFPAGSRIGLAPPPGVTPSRNFFGFEDPFNNVALVIAALPPDAFAELERSTSAEALQKQGLTVEKRETHALAANKAFLVVARQQADGMRMRKWIFALAAPDLTALVSMQVPDAASNAYPEAAIRAALMSVAVRPTVPVEEQLSLLPFKVGELAQFRVGGVIAGRALILTDGAANAPPGPDVDAHLVVAIAPGGPAQSSDRNNFARTVFASIPNLNDVRLTSSEPLRIGGQPGHQIMARGKDSRTGKDVTIVQWLRFGGGAYMHLVGVAASDAWIPAYARFRQVRDGIELR